MTNVIIYFIGLIAHVTIPATNVLPERQVAVMISDAHHQAEILVDTIAVLPTNNPFPGITTDSVGRTHVPVTGEISIVGVTTGSVPSQTTDFINDVISLKKATKNPNLNLNANVIDEKPAGAAAYIDLSAGTLDVAGYYSKMGKHSAIGTMTCVPSATFFSTIGTGSFIEFINDAGKHFRVRTGATIYITNLPDMAGAGHFAKNDTILAAGANVGSWVEGSACTAKSPIFDPAVIGAKGADIECTNSHFP
jgi:hypothetical protein